MVAAIEKFTSTATTQIPSMGIVSQSGDRAIAQSMGAIGGLFDAVADFQNQKLDEKMQRQTTELAQEAVRSGGLNPADLDDPYTTADQIYRDAALNTYSIQVDTGISQELSKLQLENKYNPAGFQKKATSYLEGTLSELAPELKDGVEKYAMGKIVSTTASLSQEVQRKALSESAAAADAYRVKLGSEMVNSAPEDRAALYAKIEASVLSDPQYLTKEGKIAALDSIQLNFSKQMGLRDAMTGDRSIPEIIDSWKNSGVMVTPSLKQQLYSSAQVETNYEKMLYNQSQQEAKANVGQIEDAFYETLFTNKDVTEGDVRKLIGETQAMMKEQNADPEEIFNFKAKALKSFMNANDDSQDVIDAININIDEASPVTPSLIKKALKNNSINPGTAQDLMNKYKTMSSQIVKSPDMQNYIQTDLRKKFPMAEFFTNQSPALQPSSRLQEQAASQQRQLMEAINEITQKVNDPEKPVSITQALAEKQGSSSQLKPAPIEITDFNSFPGAIELKNNLNSEQPNLEMFIKGSNRSEARQSFTYDDINDLGDSPKELYIKNQLQQWGDGKWSDDNKVTRLKMIQSFRENDPNSVYTDEYIKNLIKALNIKPEDIQ